jgi:hypothetical protein
LLYAHQLPPAENGPHSADEDTASRQLLNRLLNGQTVDLEPLRPGPVEIHDTALDDVQREAVARALATPDLCLIQGLPGTGKSRTVAEMIVQATARGQRILFLAPTTAALDRVLESLASHDTICSLRCLTPEEKPESLRPAIRALTFPQRARTLAEQPLQGARKQVEAAGALRQHLHQLEDCWPRLADLAENYQSVSKKIETLCQQSSRVAQEVATEADAAATADTNSNSFLTSLIACTTSQQEDLGKIEQAQAKVSQQLADRRRERDALQAQLESLRPLAAAKEQGRWWSLRFWKATFKGEVPGKVAALEAQEKAAEEALQSLEQEIQALAHQRREIESKYQAERGRLLETEVSRRQALLQEQLTALRQEQGLLQDKWQSLCAELDQVCPQPEAITAAAVQTAQERWRNLAAQAGEGLEFARQWSAYLEASADALRSQLPRYFNVVASTMTALAGDEHFGDGATENSLFDLLILEEAEQVTESEFLKAARRARRWVLVGEPEAEAAPVTGQRLPSPSSRTPFGKPRTERKVAAPRTGIFQRLWQQLHADPARLPYAWRYEGEHLCCRLRQLAPEQRQWLESERLADCPDIELRILTLPKVRPLLAEIVFPPTASLQQAKEHVYQELEEVAAAIPAHGLRWIEEAQRLIVQFAASATSDTTAVTLEPGVREIAGKAVDASAEEGDRGATWWTYRFEFDREAGWDRGRAEDWLQTHLHLRDLGRTTRLDTPYRMAPDLAAFVSALLFEGAYLQRPTPAVGPSAADLLGVCCGYPVEFVPVPPLPSRREQEVGARNPEKKKPREAAGVATAVVSCPATAVALPKSGAGLELDLAVVRPTDRLPAELRPQLPSSGYVNYLEAQAVVRTLELLAGDARVHTIMKAAAPEQSSCPAIAVLTPYPAQAALIRRLLAQSARWSASGLAAEVDISSAFRQRECLLAVVSLTRSHSHRAVSFGEGPQDLALALTRARTKLILVGDPGTLARRSQWQGILDQLDESAAAREGRVIAHLVRYLQGRGRHPQSFHLCEGSGP